MKSFKHVNAASLDQTVQILRENPGRARVTAGGTDLIGELKDNILQEQPAIMVNLKTIPGLDFIREEGSSLVIGALTRLEDIAGSDIVKTRLPALAAAAAGAASPHIRQMGTLAGNICQSNRCWYYWVPENRFNCLRKGGKNCYALTGDSRYHSIFGGVRAADTPCTRQCPDNVEIADYMSRIRAGDLKSAAEILIRRNPLPAITGRVCPHSCEGECNRRETDAAVSIRQVERFLGDFILKNSFEMYTAPKVEKNQKVAIIGSGPGGLCAAYYLRKMGYRVSILESQEQAGGMLTYGIPAYRLPRETVRNQVKAMADMGIQFELKTRVGIDYSVEFLMQNNAAVLAACGAWKERSSGIKGEEVMLSGTGFLRQANQGQMQAPGNKVAVIGGGNVAVDVARTLVRMGVDAEIIYRRGKNEMPALKDEVVKAEEENVRIHFLTLPFEVYCRGEKIILKCWKMELGSADASGRSRPTPIAGSDFEMEYDAVMTAIGEEADTSLIPAEYKNGKGQVFPDEETGRLGGNLFAAGDFVSGPATVVEAIAGGRRAAEGIDRYLRGQDVKSDQEVCRNKNATETFNSQYLKTVKRHEAVELEAEERIRSFDIEESNGLNLEEAVDEANRCFNCSCVAVNPSDLAPVLVVLQAVIVTTRRTIQAEDFFATGINSSTILDEDEVVKEVRFPQMQGLNTVFIKFALRKSIDFPVVNIAAAILSENGVVKSARICLNSVFNQPWRVRQAEQYIVGRQINEIEAGNAAQAGMAGALPLLNNRHKIKIAAALIKRAIVACTNNG